MNDLILTPPHNDEDRTVHEFWPTPASAVQAILNRLCGERGFRPRYPREPGRRAQTWCEPCVGDGAIIRAVDPFLKVWWDTCDIRDVPVDWKGENYHRPATDYREAFGVGEDFDVVITNPPFTLAREVKDWARAHASHVVLLQRLNWLGSQARGPWWREDMPDVYVLERRPSFDGKGTDGCEYAWFHWYGEDKPAGKIEVLECK